MDEILKTEGGLLDDLDASALLVLNNNFFDTADIGTIAKLEAFIGIVPNAGRTTEERCRLIKAYFVGFGKISASMLKDMISSYTGADSEVTFAPGDLAGNNYLSIFINRGDEPTLYLAEIDTLLQKKIPAHIEWSATVRYIYGIAVGCRRVYYLHDFKPAGIYPEISTIGNLAVIDLGAGQSAIGAANNFTPCGIAYAGAGGE